MTIVAFGLAAKQVIPFLLLWSKLSLSGKHSIVFGREGRDLVRGLITGNRLRHLIESCAGSTPIRRAQIDGLGIVRQRRTGSVADLLDIGRPIDVDAPYLRRKHRQSETDQGHAENEKGRAREPDRICRMLGNTEQAKMIESQ